MVNKKHIIISIVAETLWQKIAIYDKKKTLTNGYWGSIPQHNKGHLWQTYS